MLDADVETVQVGGKGFDGVRNRKQDGTPRVYHCSIWLINQLGPNPKGASTVSEVTKAGPPPFLSQDGPPRLRDCHTFQCILPCVVT